MSAFQTILRDRPVAYHPILAKACGGVSAALFLSQLLYWTGKGKLASGWIWKSADDMQEETGLTRNEQKTARHKLKAQGIIEEKLAGVPATLHYRVDFDALEAAIKIYEIESASLLQSTKLDGDDLTNLVDEKPQTIQRIPENTSHTSKSKNDLRTTTPPDPSDAETQASLPGLPAPKRKRKMPREIITTLAKVCAVDLSLATTAQKGQVTQSARILHDKAGATAASIEAFGAWWRANDWRGKKGQPPTPAQVRECWTMANVKAEAHGMRVVFTE